MQRSVLAAGLWLLMPVTIQVQHAVHSAKPPGQATKLADEIWMTISDSVAEGMQILHNVKIIYLIYLC